MDQNAYIANVVWRFMEQDGDGSDHTETGTRTVTSRYRHSIYETVNRRADQQIRNHWAIAALRRCVSRLKVCLWMEMAVPGMDLAMILAISIAPYAQTLLQDEKGHKAGQKQ